MKKLFFLVLTVLIVSCSSDDDNTSEVVTCDESKIVGVWDNQNIFTGNGAPLDTWTFNSDETGLWHKEGLPNGEQGDANIPITWVVNGTVISINAVEANGDLVFLVDFNYSFSSNCDVMNLQADANEYFPDAVNFSYDRR